MNILHKLGLYTRAEIDELIAKTAALTNSVDGVIEETKDNAECYKVALRMFNEARTVEHAVRVIQHYCENTICYDCDYAKGGCVLAHTAPCNWEV